MKHGRYAAIDIGTVTCRLLIVDVEKSGLRELERGYGITNLGEGIDATGLLKPEAIQRVIDQITLFLHMIDSYRDKDHQQIKLVTMATSAARDAKNAQDFLDALDEIGVSLSIIPGEREAALSFAGVAHDFPDENLLVVDIGGGSTEYSAGHSGVGPILSHSFDVGCRRITERFFAGDPPTDEELFLARRWVKETMQPYFDQLLASGFSVERMVAVAGTATSVASIHKRMLVYDRDEVHRSVVERDTLLQLFNKIRRMPLEQVKRIIGLDPGRAPVIVAGLMILDIAMELAEKECFTVSEADILQGIILDTATK